LLFRMEYRMAEELTCKYYVGNDALYLYCVAPSGITVVDGFRVAGNSARWSAPYVGRGAAERPKGVETAPFKGILRERAVGRLKVVEALADGKRIVAIRGEGGAIIERIWPWDAAQAGARIVKALLRRYPLRLEESIGVAARIVEPGNPAEAERKIRRELTRIDARWPEPPTRYGAGCGNGRPPSVSAAEDPINGGRALIVRVPAACRKFLIAATGDSISYGLMCTANAYAIGGQGGAYLLAEPLYISALVAEGRVACAGLGNACQGAIRDAAEKSLAVVGVVEAQTYVEAVESEKYAAYRVASYPELLYVAPRSGGAVGLLVGSLDEARWGIRMVKEGGGGENALRAALGAVWLLKGYQPDLLLPPRK